jgi:hypothetical protein
VRITEVFTTLEYDRYHPFLQAYSRLGEYLSLFISDWIRAKKLDLGKFSRIGFQEGYSELDLTIYGTSAFVICTKIEFPSQRLTQPKDIHDYFVRKYLEGFQRVDDHFKLELTRELQDQFQDHFQHDNYFYEKKKIGKKVGRTKIELVHHYTCESYILIARYFEGARHLADETLYEGVPDPFSVHFHINKIEFESRRVRIINKIGEETLVHDFPV